MENFRTFKCLLAGALCMAGAQVSAQSGGQEISRAGSQASAAGPAEFFTGRVRVDPVWPAAANVNWMEKVSDEQYNSR